MNQMSLIMREVEAYHFDQAQRSVNNSQLDSAEKNKLCNLIAHCQSIYNDLSSIGGLQQTYGKDLFFVEKGKNKSFYTYILSAKNKALSCLLSEIQRAFPEETIE